jgi:predicted TPR repeat methyltransferase
VADDAAALVAEQLRYYRARASEYDSTSYGAACGTGIWTAELGRRATTLTALDGAPEMLELARHRAPTGVRFEQTDLWSSVAAALRPGGRVVALDELPARSFHEDQRRDFWPWHARDW